MTDPQWETLLRVIRGEPLDVPPVAFLVDGGWLSGWAGVDPLDYFTDDRLWFDVNLEAARRFPDAMFLAGFWAEYGMISNPPAFGGRCVWPAEGFPTSEKVLRDYGDIRRLAKPNVRTDGLLPFLLKRLEHNERAMEQAGHRVRFATSHGPLTIASYLLGHTELLIGVRTEPEAVHKLLEIVTEFIVDWLELQKARFPSIDGLLVLDDLIGFLGPNDFQTFALPYMQRIFGSVDVSVKFLHNDAHGLITAGHLDAMGVNLFNFSFEHDVAQVRRLAGNAVTLMGNVPPRDVMALGSRDDVRRWVCRVLASAGNPRRLIVSAGGFLPPNVSSEKIDVFCQAIR